MGIRDLDSVLSELIQEVTRLNTEAMLDAKNNSVDIAFFASCDKTQLKQKNGECGNIRCRYCHEFRHVQSYCKKRNLCNYCKMTEHNLRMLAFIEE